MIIVDIADAENQWSQLIREVEGGREVVIARDGKPVAKLVPHATGRPRRRPGYLKGRMEIAPNFDAPLDDEVVDSFVSSGNGKR